MRQGLSARSREVSQIPEEPSEGKGGNDSVFPENGPCEREADPDSFSERCPGSSPSMEVLPSLVAPARTSQSTRQSLPKEVPEDSKVPCLEVPSP